MQTDLAQRETIHKKWQNGTIRIWSIYLFPQVRDLHMTAAAIVNNYLSVIKVNGFRNIWANYLSNKQFDKKIL